MQILSFTEFRPTSQAVFVGLSLHRLAILSKVERNRRKKATKPFPVLPLLFSVTGENWERKRQRKKTCRHWHLTKKPTYDFAQIVIDAINLFLIANLLYQSEWNHFSERVIKIQCHARPINHLMNARATKMHLWETKTAQFLTRCKKSRDIKKGSRN